MKYSIFGLLAVLAIFASAGTVQAQTCVHNGYLFSGSECGTVYQGNFTYQPVQPVYTTNQQAIRTYIIQLEALLQQLRALQSQTNMVVQNPFLGNQNTGATGRSEVDVTTRSATDIDEDRARLRGELDFNREDEATVYFEWGVNRNRLSETTILIVLDEGDDDESFYQTITRLNDNTTYYYRAVAQDERGRTDFGSVTSFRTDDDRGSSSRNNDDEPEVETGDARDISENSAKIEGEVDMNDFDNGILFFVYGEDEDQVDGIARNYDEYRDIDEDRDDLQKMLVDSDVDGRANAFAEIFGLDEDTDIFYAMCVQFEDDDNDDLIICGETEEFTTDRD